jgi:hypothetical protein
MRWENSILPLGGRQRGYIVVEIPRDAEAEDTLVEGIVGGEEIALVA